MGLITKTIKIKWSPSNKKHYESLGYIYTKMGDEFEVRVEDLTKGSQAKIECSCDNCKKLLIWEYRDYSKKVKENGKTYCNKCAIKLYGGENTRITRLKNGKSLYKWCIENNRQDVLDRWDYEKNGCTPKDVSYSSNKNMWFKCNRSLEHKSELKIISSLTRCEGSLDCKQCNSIAQYILDNFQNKKLEEVWDYEKNGELDPWKISRGSKVKIWIFCQEKDYHGSYEIFSHDFIKGVRCSFCAGRKVRPLDSLKQYIVNNYGEEFFNIIWSNKNTIDPTTIAPNSHTKIWWNCPEGKHKTFERSCRNSKNCNYRCPECVKEKEESIIEEKTRLYLEELGYEVKTEYNCTIRPINPKTRCPLPFDNEIILKNGKHLIIEVHGIQHYKIDGYYNKTEEELHYRQVKDRYKRIKCIQAGYYYLEISYTAFDKKETYKKLIDNKIKNTLDK